MAKLGSAPLSMLEAGAYWGAYRPVLAALQQAAVDGGERPERTRHTPLPTSSSIPFKCCNPLPLEALLELLRWAHPRHPAAAGELPMEASLLRYATDPHTLTTTKHPTPAVSQVPDRSRLSNALPVPNTKHSFPAPSGISQVRGLRRGS